MPPWVWAFTLYLVVSIVVVGRGAVAHPTHVCACIGGADPSAYMWSLAWWPHALIHGMNPLFTRSIWAPGGADVAAAATIPAAAVALSPVTALFGPLVSYNVLAILSAPLSGLTAYLLCRRLTARHGASLVGGFLFGFSSYQFSQLLGHLNLTLVFLLPVIVHLALRRLNGELSRFRFVASLGGVLIVQALLSTEILLDVVLLGGTSLIVAYLTAEKPNRSKIDAVAREIALAGMGALVILLPYLFASLQQAPVARGAAYGLDPLNLLIPTPVTWFGGHISRGLSVAFEQRNYSETDGYVGLPLLLAFGAFVRGSWRASRVTRVLTIMFVISIVAAAGPTLAVAGLPPISLPSQLLERLPLIPSLVPSRISVVFELIVAISIALWLGAAGGHSARRWPIVVLAIIALLPDLSGGWWRSSDNVPAFFRTTQYTRYLAPGEDVLAIPFGQSGNSMLWQADASFYFTMPGGYISDALPKAAALDPAIQVLFTGSTPHVQIPPGAASLIRSFLARHDVRHVVIEPGYEKVWSRVFSQIADPPLRVGGILLFTVK